MTEMVLRAVAKVSAESAFLACVGEDSWQAPWVWLAPEMSPTRKGEQIDVPGAQLLPGAAGMPVNRLLEVLAYWPAWRVTEWARLGIGSGVLIVGSGGLARQVVDLCRCRGALWRAVWGTSEVRDDGEFWFPPSPAQQAREMCRALPGQPDSVVVLGGSVQELAVALTICRDLGTVVVAVPSDIAMDVNFYPDVHRRGLTIRAGSPFEYGPGDVEGWNRAARRIDALIDMGLLGR